MNFFTQLSYAPAVCINLPSIQAYENAHCTACNAVISPSVMCCSVRHHTHTCVRACIWCTTHMHSDSDTSSQSTHGQLHGIDSRRPRLGQDVAAIHTYSYLARRYICLCRHTDLYEGTCAQVYTGISVPQRTCHESQCMYTHVMDQSQDLGHELLYTAFICSRCLHKPAVHSSV